MNLVNKGRLVSLNVHRKRTEAVRNLTVNFNKLLTAAAMALVASAEESNAIDTKVNSNILNEVFRIDPERVLDGDQISQERLLRDINLKEQQDLVTTSLDMDFDGQLDRAITSLLNGMKSDNQVEMITWSKVLDQKFGVKTSEILTPVEQNRLASLMMRL
jgi:hypothetical protein